MENRLRGQHCRHRLRACREPRRRRAVDNLAVTELVEDSANGTEGSVAAAVVEDSVEVRYVVDSMTEVPDSQVADVVANEVDVVLTLLQLASIEVSIFEFDKDIDKVIKLMLPVMFPKWYGGHCQESHEAATSLVW